MDTTFEVERAPLVLNSTPKTLNKKTKVVLSTILGVIGTIALVCIVGYTFAGDQTWMSEKTPNVLKVLPVLNMMVDMTQTTNDLHSQVSQIKYRADSVDNLAKDSKVNSNVGIIIKSWDNMLKNEKELTSFDKTIAQSLLTLIQNYDNLRKTDPAFKNIKNVDQLKRMMEKAKRQHKKMWNNIRTEITDENPMVKQVDLLDAINSAFDLSTAAAVKLCKDLAFYQRWWNTVKGWFGSKSTCTKSILLSTVPTTLCSKLVWYKRWCNTVVGWFGSKPHNCVNLTTAVSALNKPWVMLKEKSAKKDKKNKSAKKSKKSKSAKKDKKSKAPKKKKKTKAAPKKTAKAAPLVKCSSKGMFGRMWASTKGALGFNKGCKDSKIEVVEENNRVLAGMLSNPMGSMVDNLKAKVTGAVTPKPLCSSLPFYKKAFNTAKSCVGMKATGCKKSINLSVAMAKCSSLAWYKRWWNTMKGWFGSKPTNCTKVFINLATKPYAGTTQCKDLAWYKRWWNTVKGWFGSKPHNCLSTLMLSVITVDCQSLAWYKRWWNTMKGWFGSKPTNCSKPKVVNIKSYNENNAALQVMLSQMSELTLSTNIVMTPVYDTTNGTGMNDMINMIDSLADHTERMQPMPKAVHNFNLEKSQKENWFEKFAEVFRNKGLAIELYEKPVAEDLLAKIPSFVDGEAKNEAVKFLDTFEKSKSVILENDGIDRAFLSFFEKLIMTWATTETKDLEKLSNAYIKSLTA